MPRYYFHIHDGVSELDTEGTELSDWRAAQLAAIETAGQILHDNARHIALGDDWRVEVTDHTGLILFQLVFAVIHAPAVIADPLLGRS